MGTRTVIVGVMQITYKQGATGPSQYQLVTMEGFEKVRHAVGAYRLIEQLREMADQSAADNEARRLLTGAGIEAAPRPRQTRRSIELVTYRTRASGPGLTPTNTFELPVYDFFNVNLVGTFEVQVPA